MENLVYALNQFLHNVLVVIFAGGVLLGWGRLGGKGQGAHQSWGGANEAPQFVVQREARRCSLAVLGLIVTGANFGLISLWFHSALPALTPIAKGALLGKITGALLSLGILHVLARSSPLPAQERLGQILQPILRVLVLGILLCAAVLRFFA